MLKVAMLSKWHVHAEGYAKQVLDYGAKITSVWDDDAVRGAAWAQELGVDFYDDLDELLAKADVDAVVCNAPTAHHKDVLVKAANAGKHIFTEKAMAPTVAECDEIIAAIEKNNVKFLISMPGLTTPAMQYAKFAIDSGLLGRVNLVRIRNGHDGASANWLPEYWYDETMAGGGAMMDLGCHPMYEVSYFLGRPARIVSMYNSITDRAVEDNAVNVIEFENKCIAIVETSLVTHRTPGALEVYGTEGTLIQKDRKLYISSKQYADANKGFIEVTNLPEAKPLPLILFLDACTKDTPIPFGTKEGRNLTELLEKAYIAHKTSTEVKF